MATTATLTTPAPPTTAHPAWCHPIACFGDGFHATESVGPDPGPWVTLLRSDEDSKTWVSLNDGDLYLPPMTVAEARELAAALLELVAAAQRG